MTTRLEQLVAVAALQATEEKATALSREIARLRQQVAFRGELLKQIAAAERQHAEHTRELERLREVVRLTRPAAPTPREGSG